MNTRIRTVILSVLSSVFMIIACILPVQAKPTVKLEETMIFLHPGETKTYSYSYTGEAPEFHSTESGVCSSWMDDKKYTVKADDKLCGYEEIEVYSGDEFVDKIKIYVYLDIDEVLNFPDYKKQICTVDQGTKKLIFNVPREESRYAPVTMTSSDPSVAKPVSAKTAVCDMDMQLLKPGVTTVTVDTGKGKYTIELTVLKSGNYAESVETKDGGYTVYVEKGKTIDSPFIMKNAKNNCSDDKLSYRVLIDSEGEADHGVITISEDGKITGVREGDADVEAKSILGAEGGVTVNVYTAPEQITFPKKTYYIDQFNMWLEGFPTPVYKDAKGYFGPYTVTSSNPDVVKVTQIMDSVLYSYVSDGECTIRYAYKNNPKIYAEFKAVAYTAQYPDKITIPNTITTYVDFMKEIPVKFTPNQCMREVSEITTEPVDIAYAAYYPSSSVVAVTGVKAGNTALHLEVGPNVPANAKVTVIDKELPVTAEYTIRDLTSGNRYSEPLQEKNKEFFLVKDHVYYLEMRLTSDDLLYVGYDEKYSLKADDQLKKSDKFAGVHEYDESIVRLLYFTPVKAGTTEVELITGTKIKLTVKELKNKIEMHRLYNKNSGEHFYTAKKAEKDFLVRQGWTYENIGWIAPEKSNTPVYRLYNENSGDHHYTMNLKERNALIGFGWKDEGIGWYSDDDKEVILYREYNPNMDKCNHNYTTNKKEHDALTTKLGWNDEGIGWYGIKE